MALFALFSLQLGRTGRQARTHWIRALYVSLLGTLVALAWVAECDGRPWTQQEAVGQALFALFGWTQLILLPLASLLTLAGALAGERSRGTLSLLLATRLSPLGLVVGKLLAGLIPVGWLLLAGLPILALLLLFGGLAPGRVLAIEGLTLLAAALAGGAALAVSARVRRPHLAFALALGLTLLVAPFEPFRPPLPAAALPANPFAAAAVLLDGAPFEDPAALGGALAFAALGLALLLPCAALPLRRLAAGDGAQAGRRRWRGPLGADADPVAWQVSGGFRGALRTGFRPAVWIALALALALVLQPAALVLAPSGGVATAHGWALPALLGLVLLAGGLLGARAFAAEREEGNLDLLLSTPLDRGALLRGKLAGSGQAVAPLLLPVIAYPAIFAAAGALPPWIALAAPLAGIGFGGVLLILTVLAAARLRPLAALATATGLLLALDLLFVGGGYVLRMSGVGGSPVRATMFWWVTGAWEAALRAPAGSAFRAAADLGAALGLHLLAALLLWRAALRRADDWLGGG